MDLTNISALRQALVNVSDETLDSVYSAVAAQKNYRRGNKIQEAKAALYIGAEVRVLDHNRKTAGKTFIVEKINQKNVKCYEKDLPSRKWTITASLLEPVS